MPESGPPPKSRRGMLGAPPALDMLDDGHVEGAEMPSTAAQRLDLRPGGKAAQQKVA